MLLAAISLSAQQPDPADPAFFSTNIQPVFEQQCFSCHNPDSDVSKLDLTSRAGLMRGGGRGPSIVPGNPSRSLLYKTITQQSQPFMPMGMAPLSGEAIANIAAWIEAGARYGESVVTEGPPDERRAKGEQLFREHVQPLFESTCLKCHSPETKASGLDLSTRDALLAGGENGKVVEPGQAQQSKLYKAVAHLSEPHMPFRSEKLPSETIDRLAGMDRRRSAFRGRAEGVVRHDPQHPLGISAAAAPRDASSQEHRVGSKPHRRLCGRQA